MGLVLGFGFMVAISWIFQRKSPRQVDTLFRKLQLFSAAAYSLGHGGNDAQKTMGIVAGALYTAGVLKQTDFERNWGHWHWPIILAAHTAIALGTYFGGWRIVHTMGSKITKLKPVGGFCAETAGALRCGAPRWREFRSAPRTRLPARSWESEPRIAFRRYAGALRGELSGRGF